MITSADSVVRARIDSRTKEKAARVLKKRGWNMSVFLRVIISSVAETGEIPAIPNAETAKAVRAAQRGELHRAGKTRDEINAALWN